MPYSAPIHPVGVFGVNGSDEKGSVQFTGVKVFSATKAKEREELGDSVTRWLRSNSDFEVVDPAAIHP